MAAKFEPILTIADLDSMPEDGNRYELIEGELFVSGVPSLVHQGILRDSIFVLGSYLSKSSVGQIYPGPGVILSDFSGVIPDMVFVTNERLKEIAGGDRIEGAPELIIEILSPGAENERRDRHTKRRLYRKYGVKEYWVVNAQRREIEVYRTARLRLVTTLGMRDELTSPLLPGFRCLVKDILG
jgi:Uma2 family endonuclease